MEREIEVNSFVTNQLASISHKSTLHEVKFIGQNEDTLSFMSPVSTARPTLIPFGAFFPKTKPISPMRLTPNTQVVPILVSTQLLYP